MVISSNTCASPPTIDIEHTLCIGNARRIEVVLYSKFGIVDEDITATICLLKIGKDCIHTGIIYHIKWLNITLENCDNLTRFRNFSKDTKYDVGTLVELNGTVVACAIPLDVPVTKLFLLYIMMMIIMESSVHR